MQISIIIEIERERDREGGKERDTHACAHTHTHTQPRSYLINIIKYYHSEIWIAQQQTTHNNWFNHGEV